jgi:UDP-4-amino-4-deoxy-L-arabinose formyltransferase/UDP-glucuronic acid dehydrogenase (UDP-4-keto-hexauronic acid decarboxylating)
VRVVLLAYHDLGCAGLRILRQARDQVTAVYTHRDDPREEPWFGSVADLAAEYGVPTYFPKQINTAYWIEHIRSQRPDILFSCYYRKLVCDEILRIPPLGAINLHGSYLPHYRGRCPLNWVLIRGERRTGVTMHYMVQKADAGDIVAQRPIRIESDDTAPTLHEKIVSQGADLLRQMLPEIRLGTNPRRPQRIADGSYFGRRFPEDGRIDWSLPAERIHNLVRGVTRPFPGARTELDGRTLFIWHSRVEAADVAPGEPGAVDLSEGLRIQTGCGTLRVLECQRQGERSLPEDQFMATLDRRRTYIRNSRGQLRCVY